MVSTSLPGSEAPAESLLLQAVEAHQRQGVEASALFAETGDEFDEEILRRALYGLLGDGRVVEWRGRLLAARFTDWVVGTIQGMTRGDALLLSGEHEEPGYFIAARHRQGALDGDLVLARPSKRRSKGSRGLPQATVVRILTPRRRQVVGRVVRERGQKRWLPFDPKDKLDIRVQGGDGLGEEEFVVLELSAAGEHGGPVQGRVVEVLGDPEEPGVDVAIVIRHYQIPDVFPDDVMAAADALPEHPEAADWNEREDLRERVIVTIDGATARDFDDAIEVEALAGGGFRLGVHIADVSHYVVEGSQLDREAYRRGTSVYYPEGAIPMLPERLSNGLCSLLPEVPRLTMSAFVDFDSRGKPFRRRFASSVIQSRRRMTYSEVRRLLEEPQDSDEAEYGAVLPMLRQAGKLARILNQRRVERGSLDFDLPEGNVVLDSDGFMVGILPSERNIAHRLIEEFMIAANEAVAQELEGHECPALFRVHDPPDPLRLEELRQLLATFGLQLPGDMESLHPSALQEVLERVQGRPEEALVSTLVLRTMQRAIYAPECRGHYALASRYYCHFTSPIRRYPDLLVHRQLRHILHGDWRETSDRTLLEARLPAMGQHTSRTERRAERSERDLLQWKKVRYLEDRVGDTFEGQITGVQPFGLFVQLGGLLVDGLVPIASMEDDYYLYEPERHRLVGEHMGRIFRLGDPVEVVLASINEVQRGLELAIADMKGGRESGAGGPAG